MTNDVTNQIEPVHRDMELRVIEHQVTDRDDKPVTYHFQIQQYFVNKGWRDIPKVFVIDGEWPKGVDKV